jgi:formamidopyrimidine-DNA glycosylase
MPELAEVEFYRRQWDAGVGHKILSISLHEKKRVFRGIPSSAFDSLAGTKFVGSEAAGKQMLFHFSGRAEQWWLGIHLGMTGKLSTQPRDFHPGSHDHLVLYQAERALVFTDPRQFGRVHLDSGSDAPEWWKAIPPAVTSAQFTLSIVSAFLDSHSRLPIKATLLLQDGFPGIGNWMADEILWRAHVAPARPSASLENAERKALWRETRFVARGALRTVGEEIDSVPPGWLFHERWSAKGVCPKHKTPLRRQTIGGRTTSWCPKCQH